MDLPTVKVKAVTEGCIEATMAKGSIGIYKYHSNKVKIFKMVCLGHSIYSGIFYDQKLSVIQVQKVL